MSDTYHLVTIADLLKVPLERRSACLQELEYSLALMDLMTGNEGTITTSGFTWTDDGERKSTINVNGEEFTLHLQEVEKP